MDLPGNIPSVSETLIMFFYEPLYQIPVSSIKLQDRLTFNVTVRLPSLSTCYNNLMSPWHDPPSDCGWAAHISTWRVDEIVWNNAGKAKGPGGGSLMKTDC